MPWRGAIAVALFVLLVGASPVEACLAGGNTPWPSLERVRSELARAPNEARAPIGEVLRAETRRRAAEGDACQGGPWRELAETILATLRDGGTVLLGEVHDNPFHHAIRAALLTDLAGALLSGDGRNRPALVFEHIRADQQDDLNRFAARSAKGTVEDLMQVLDWENSGWPEARMFEPLFAAALGADLPILAGDPPRPSIRKVAKEGEGALGSEERTTLQLDRPLEPKLQDALLTELEASHCGLMPKTAFTTMAVAQRYRDAHLAKRIADAAEKYGSAVLLAGNNHVRTDRGVPWYLERMVPGRKVVSVMLVEAEEKTDSKAYFTRDPEGKLAADFVLFTPRAERADPCERMKTQFKKRG